MQTILSAYMVAGIYMCEIISFLKVAKVRKGHKVIILSASFIIIIIIIHMDEEKKKKINR